MGMDPKQDRALRSAEPRPRPRRTTAAVTDTRVNIEGDTPVDRLARGMGAEPIPEGGTQQRKSVRRAERGREGRNGANGGDAGTAPEVDAGRRLDRAAPVAPTEAERTLRARREHSKGDGNVPSPEPHAGLLEERPEDRTPRDLPKARDDRSAHKGNITAGQEERNPELDVRDDFEPPAQEPVSGFDRAREVALRADAPTPRRRSTRPTARRASAAKRKATTRRPRADKAAANVRRAAKNAVGGTQRASTARRPGVGTRRTGAAPRRNTVRRSTRGNVTARKAKKASLSRAKDRREKKKRG